MEEKCILSPFRMGLSRAAQEWQGAKRRPSLKSITHILNDKTWHTYTLTKEDPKIHK